MSVLKGDFIGFTFNNVHSSDLGLVRTSGGNRYDENLLPSFSDKTQQADGMNGVYYFGTNYNQKDLSVPVAYDSVTEEQKRRIIMLFGENTVCPLIFDETPYKVYYAKISNPPSLSFICFDDKHGERVYKGEGVINFTVHSFAKSRYKYLEEYTMENIPEWDEITENKDQWAAASRMKWNLKRVQPDSGTAEVQPFDNFYLVEQGISIPELSANEFSGYSCYVWNAGDMPTDFEVSWDIALQEGVPIILPVIIKLDGEDKMHFALDEEIERTVLNPNDARLIYNSKTQLIEGADISGNKTGSVYNGLITAGEFFKLPCNFKNKSKITLISPETNAVQNAKIKYDYLYY